MLSAIKRVKPRLEFAIKCRKLGSARLLVLLEETQRLADHFTR